MNKEIEFSRTIIDATDTLGIIYEGKKCYKVHSFKGPKARYIEINKVEYDKRVSELATKVITCKSVNLSDVLKDALYDLPLSILDKIESRVNEEISTAKREGREPDIKTTKRDRGTCVNLAIKGRYALELRE